VAAGGLRTSPTTGSVEVIGWAPTLVLLYHRVAAPSHDVHDLCVTPEHFADQIAHLAQEERPVPLGEAGTRSLRRRVVVTFDDGYADNVLDAMPILQAYQVPATFFVTAGLVDSEPEQWSDELERVVLWGEPRSRHLEVHIDGRSVLLDMGSERARERSHWAIYHRLRPLRTGAIEDVLQQLRPQVDAPARDRASARFMTSDELARAASGEVITIGAHGLTHQLLASLSAEEQQDEIVTSRRRLQSLTGQSIDTFAYPFGGPDTFDDTTVRLVTDAGFRLACAGWSGLVRPRTDRFRLPRAVVKDWDLGTFADKLEGWFRA
jgi:peptidoglycan/xylan/chitin deacetylase (PgdA/CDA1 family)